MSMKKRNVLSLIAAGLIFSSVLGGAFASDAAAFDIKTSNILKVGIEGMSAAEIERLKKDKNTINWCELDNELIITCAKTAHPEMTRNVRNVRALPVKTELSVPFVAICRGSVSPLNDYKDSINIIAKSGAYTIFQAEPYVIEELTKLENNHFKLEKFDQNLPLLVNIKNIDVVKFSRSAGEPVFTPDKESIKAGIKKLEDFKTRYSYSKGYTDAVDYAANQFKKLGFEIKLSEYKDGGNKQINVVAQKSFSDPADGFYIICAHLDSMSPNPSVSAPGADDNASGSAGVLEAARLLANTPNAKKFRFVLFAGEELGLKGSAAYVRELKSSGELSKTLGVVNFDMIGFDKKSPLSSLFETYKEHEQFISKFIAEAKNNGKLNITVSYKPWGSDHVPFLKEKVPCFLFIEDEYEDNANYHQVTDVSEHVNIDLAAEIIRVTVTTLYRITLR